MVAPTATAPPTAGNKKKPSAAPTTPQPTATATMQNNSNAKERNPLTNFVAF